MPAYSGADNGKSGGTFDNPQRPQNYTPGQEDGRDAPDSFVGQHVPTSDSTAFGSPSAFVNPTDNFAPTKYAGWTGHDADQRYSFDTATDLDDSPGDSY